MQSTDRDNPETAAEAKLTATEVAARLHEARRDRSITTAPAPARRRDDPMMSLSSRPRRKRCRYCRYRFNYRMHTNRCPECGKYRDDYPQPNHGLHAMLVAGALVGGLCALIVLAVILQSL